MTPEHFINFLEKSAIDHLNQKGCDIGDKIAWGMVAGYIECYKKTYTEKDK